MKIKIPLFIFVCVTLAFMFSSCIDGSSTTLSHITKGSEAVPISNGTPSAVTPEPQSEVSSESIASGEATFSRPSASDFPPHLVESIDDGNLNYIQTDKTLAQDSGYIIETWDLGKLYTINGEIIGNGGEMLLSNFPQDSSAVSELYLANVENRTTTLIHTEQGEIAYDVLYHDDEIIVFYTYQMWGNLSTPIEYFMYNLQKGEVEVLDIKKLSMPDIQWNCNFLTRLGDELYFEVQEFEDEYKSTPEGTVPVRIGRNMYKYNLITGESEHVVDGAWWIGVYNDEIVYVDVYDSTMKLQNLEGETIVDGMLEYASLVDKMVYTTLDEYETSMDFYSLKNGKSEKILTLPGTFCWGITANSKYLAWMETEPNLYVYSLKDQELQFVSNRSRSAFVSEKYMYWTYSDYDEHYDMEKAEMTLEYIKFTDD